MVENGYNIGDKIGRWTVIQGPFRLNFKSCKPWGYRVKCECGTERNLMKGNLKGGTTLSCGCFRPQILHDQRVVHGDKGKRLYNIWKAMKRRCNSPTDSCYQNYGAKGIKICPEWNNSYIYFREWANNHGYSDTLTIDRIKGTGNYEPNNCRWATYQEQANNLKSNRILHAFGESKSMADWSRDPRCTVSYGGLNTRIIQNWSHLDAITRPRYIRKDTDHLAPAF